MDEVAALASLALLTGSWSFLYSSPVLICDFYEESPPLPTPHEKVTDPKNLILDFFFPSRDSISVPLGIMWKKKSSWTLSLRLISHFIEDFKDLGHRYSLCSY